MNGSRNYLWILSGLILFGSACAEKAPDTDGPLFAMADRVEIIKNSTHVMATQLKIVSADEAQSTYLRDDNRIAGYPLANKLIALTQEDSSLIKQILLSDTAYAMPLIRCANKTFYGIRFITEHDKVEFALGKPCNQVIWAFHGKDALKQWGGVMNNKEADKILSIIQNAH